MEKTLAELAELFGGSVKGDGSVLITGPAPIDEADEGDISFLSNPKYSRFIKNSRASAIILSAKEVVSGKNLLVHKNPYYCWARVVELFYRKEIEPAGISKLAFVDKSSQISEDISIHPFAYVGARTRLCKGTIIYPGVYIGDDVTIGEDCIIYPNVSIMDKTTIGDSVIIQPGAVLGSDGFGYAIDEKKYHKIPQVGRVEIGDDVEIGANTTIDRAALGVTSIKRGVKIDNLVQIAHNVKIGEDCAIVAQVGISGSASVGNNVSIGGQAGIGGHLKVGDNVMIGARSGVTKDIPPDSVVSGFPPIPHKRWLRAQATFGKLPEIRKELTLLQKRVKELEEILKSGN